MTWLGIHILLHVDRWQVEQWAVLMAASVPSTVSDVTASEAVIQGLSQASRTQYLSTPFTPYTLRLLMAKQGWTLEVLFLHQWMNAFSFGMIVAVPFPDVIAKLGSLTTGFLFSFV